MFKSVLNYDIMSVLSSIITTLNSEEQVDFVAHLQKKNKRHDTKNIQLFKLLAQEPNAQNIDQLIYGKKAKGAYHALCKRLYDSLIDFIALKSFEGEQSEEMEIFKLVLASRIFFEQKVHKVALRTLNKAEQNAKALEFYSILNEIYYTRIQYAHLDNKTNLEELIVEFNANKKLVEQEEKLNLFYASIQNGLLNDRFNSAQIIRNALVRFQISVDNGLSFRSLFKIIEVSNKVANVTRDFYSLLPFVEKINSQIELKESLSDKHLFYHIQILYYIANSYFRNKDFKISQDYLAFMNAEMLKQNEKYYSQFLPQLILLRVLNLNYTGNSAEAIQVLEQFEYLRYKQQFNYILDLKLTLVVLYFQQSRYKEALGLYKEFQHSDKWYEDKADVIWVIKKNLIEIMLHIELCHVDLIESRVKSFRKKHSVYLKAHNEHRVLEFLTLAMHYYNANIIDPDKFMERMQKALVKTNSKHEDVFMISFYAWLKAKYLKLDVYEVTLELVFAESH